MKAERHGQATNPSDMRPPSRRGAAQIGAFQIFLPCAIGMPEMLLRRQFLGASALAAGLTFDTHPLKAQMRLPALA